MDLKTKFNIGEYVYAAIPINDDYTEFRLEYGVLTKIEVKLEEVDGQMKKDIKYTMNKLLSKKSEVLSENQIGENQSDLITYLFSPITEKLKSLEGL